MTNPNASQSSPLFWMMLPNQQSSVQKSVVSFQQVSLPAASLEQDTTGLLQTVQQQTLQQSTISFQQQQQQPLMTIPIQQSTLPLQQPVFMPPGVSSEKSMSIHTVEHSAVTLTLPPSPQLLPGSDPSSLLHSSLGTNAPQALVNPSSQQSVPTPQNPSTKPIVPTVVNASIQNSGFLQEASFSSKTIATKDVVPHTNASSSPAIYILPAPPKVSKLPLPSLPEKPPQPIQSTPASQQLILSNQSSFGAQNVVLSVPTTQQSPVVQPQQLFLSTQSSPSAQSSLSPQQIVLPLQSSNPIILQNVPLNGSQSQNTSTAAQQLPASQPSSNCPSLPASQPIFLMPPQNSGSPIIRSLLDLQKGTGGQNAMAEKSNVTVPRVKRPRVTGAFKRPYKKKQKSKILPNGVAECPRPLAVIEPKPPSYQPEQRTEITSLLKEHLTSLQQILHRIDPITTNEPSSKSVVSAETNSKTDILSPVKTEPNADTTIHMEQTGSNKDKLKYKVSFNVTSMLEAEEEKKTACESIATQTRDAVVVDLTDDDPLFEDRVKEESSIIKDESCGVGQFSSVGQKSLIGNSSSSTIVPSPMLKGISEEISKPHTTRYRKIAPKITIHHNSPDGSFGKNTIQANITNNVTVDVNISAEPSLHTDLNQEPEQMPSVTASRALCTSRDLTNSYAYSGDQQEEKCLSNVHSFHAKDAFLNDLASLAMDHINNVVKQNCSFSADQHGVRRVTEPSAEHHSTRSGDILVKMESDDCGMGLSLKPYPCSARKCNEGPYILPDIQPSGGGSQPEELTSELESFMKLCEEASGSLEVLGNIGLQMETIKTEAASP